MSSLEESYFGTEVPIDVVGTGGTIPSDIGDFKKLRQEFDEMNEFSLTKKSY